MFKICLYTSLSFAFTITKQLLIQLSDTATKDVVFSVVCFVMGLSQNSRKLSKTISMKLSGMVQGRIY